MKQILITCLTKLSKRRCFFPFFLQQNLENEPAFITSDPGFPVKRENGEWFKLDKLFSVQFPQCLRPPNRLSIINCKSPSIQTENNISKPSYPIQSFASNSFNFCQDDPINILSFALKRCFKKEKPLNDADFEFRTLRLIRKTHGQGLVAVYAVIALKPGD